MPDIQYHRITSEDSTILNEIAKWYFNEWQMDPATTIPRISNFPATGVPLHLLMTVDGIPVATGGLADHVSLMHEAPHLTMYKPWLALVHTHPEHQNKGYGTMLCIHLEKLAKEQGIKEYFLFTYTAEKLYIKLGWEVMERFMARGKNMVVMRKEIG